MTLESTTCFTLVINAYILSNWTVTLSILTFFKEVFLVWYVMIGYGVLVITKDSDYLD